MKRTLIISNKLSIGGAEKLIYELANFSKSNLVEPTVLVLDNYGREFYDDLLSKQRIKVVRTRLSNVKNFRSPIRMLRSLIWLVKLKYFADFFYQSIQVIGLYNVDKIYNIIKHKRRFFWNINNAAQYADRVYQINDKIFGNGADSIVNINRYQETELVRQFGKNFNKAKMITFKLFLCDVGD